eukprot:9485221-Pyramimonas_sp.AAC.1
MVVLFVSSSDRASARLHSNCPPATACSLSCRPCRRGCHPVVHPGRHSLKTKCPDTPSGSSLMSS